LDEVFGRLGLGKNELQLYLELSERGPATAGRLSQKLSIPRSSLYGFLAALEQRGLVARGEKGPVTRWHAESPDRIGLLLDRELNSFEKAKSEFLRALPALQEKRMADVLAPRFRFAEGPEGVRGVLLDMLLYRDLETEAFWPIREMVEILGEEFFVDLNVRRIRQNLYTRAIWPPGRSLDVARFPFLGVGQRFKREIRAAPGEVDCTLGYWAYGSRVAFISSARECFGFVVESRELREMLKTQFDMLWKISTPIDVDPRSAETFLEAHGI
jgi:sugar-specific transcriptional regulator TrmB